MRKENETSGCGGYKPVILALRKLGKKRLDVEASLGDIAKAFQEMRRGGNWEGRREGEREGRQGRKEERRDGYGSTHL